MVKKIVIGVLLFTVIAAGASMVAYRAYAGESETVSAISPNVAQQPSSSIPSDNPQLNAQENMGEPWQAEGTIVKMDANGFTLSTEAGDFYVELGPTSYWQAQSATLDVGAQVAVEGTDNAGMIHAIRVTLADDQELQLRTDAGQPLWSGGATNSRGQNRGQNAGGANAGGTGTGQTDGLRSPEPQAQVDEWLNVNGTVTAIQTGSMTVTTPEGENLIVQTGQPRFFSAQGVNFAVGDSVTLIGYYDNGQFVAGEITQTSTGARVILRDPNGRPLWSGPGNGNGKGGNH